MVTRIKGVTESPADWDVAGQAEAERERQLQETGGADPFQKTAPEGGTAQDELAPFPLQKPEEVLGKPSDEEVPLMLRQVDQQPSPGRTKKAAERVVEEKPTQGPGYEEYKKSLAGEKLVAGRVERAGEVAGAAAKIKEQADIAEFNRQALEDNKRRDANLKSSRDQRIRDLEAEFENYRELGKKTFTEGGGDIDPDRYLGSGFTPKRIGAALAVFAASFGGPQAMQAAMSNINGAIDRDIAAQKADRARGKMAITGQRNLLSDMIKIHGSIEKGEAATRQAMRDNLKVKIDARMATAKSETERANLQKLQGQNMAEEAKDKEAFLRLDPTPLNKFTQPHLVKEKVQRERYVALGKAGGFYATNKKQAEAASAKVAAYKPTIEGLKNMKNWARKNTGILGKKTAFSFLPTSANKQMKEMQSDLLNEFRGLQGAGANFTEAEMKIISDIIGTDMNSFTFEEYDKKYARLEDVYTRKLSTILSANGVDVAPGSLTQLFSYREGEEAKLRAKTKPRIQ